MWDICHFISHLSYFRIIGHAGTGIQNILAMCDEKVGFSSVTHQQEHSITITLAKQHY